MPQLYPYIRLLPFLLRPSNPPKYPPASAHSVRFHVTRVIYSFHYWKARKAEYAYRESRDGQTDTSSRKQEPLRDSLTPPLSYCELPLFVTIHMYKSFPSVRKWVRVLNWLTWLGTRPKKVFLSSRWQQPGRERAEQG